jgi:hypothetical protein
MLSPYPGTGFAVGRSARRQTRKPPLRKPGAVSLIGAVLAVMLLWACVLPTLAAAEGPPSLQASFKGSLSDEYTYETGEGPSGTETADFSWAGTGLFTAEDHGALQPVTFSSVVGKKTSEGAQIYCHSSKPISEYRELEASILESQKPEDWEISETLNYPMPGWLYEVSPTVIYVPILWTGDREIGTACEEALTEPQAEQVNELEGGYSGGGCPVDEKKREELLATLYVTPGGSGGQTREYHRDCEGDFSGKGHWYDTVTITLTVTATSPGTNNAINPPTGGGGTTTMPPPTFPPPAQRPASEKRRAELKEQAKADLRPALESSWQAHGLLGALALAHGYAFSEAADSVGGAATLFGGNDDVLRTINDYRIAKDPPAPEYEALAEPSVAKPPALPSCGRYRGRSVLAYCKALRAAAASLLSEGSEVAASDEAMYTTISRDTAAIAASAYGAAEGQASHFEVLRSQFEGALAAQGQAGTRVAGLLRKAHVDGNLTKAQSAKAIKWLDGQLRVHGITPSEIHSLTPTALAAKRVNAFTTLANPLS